MNIDDSFATRGVGTAISRRGLLGAGAAALWLAVTGSAGADTIKRTFYVAKTGNDSNPGTQTKPFLTINGVFRRITDLGAGDRILVASGTYNESVNVKAGGNATANLMLVSQVRGGAKIRSPASSYSAIAIEKSYVTIDGFDVQSGGGGHGIEASWLNGGAPGSGPHHITVSTTSATTMPAAASAWPMATITASRTTSATATAPPIPSKAAASRSTSRVPYRGVTPGASSCCATPATATLP